MKSRFAPDARRGALSISALCRLAATLTLVGAAVLRADTLLNTSTFTFTGSNQSYTAPAGTDYLVVKTWGAGGGSGFISAGGGGGGFVSAVVPSSGGTSYTVAVGQRGQGWNNGGANGWPDGYGSPNIGTGGGGGSSTVFNSGGTIRISAPGGGGAGDTNGHGSDASGAGGGRTYAGGYTGTGSTNGGRSGFRFAGGGDGGQFLFTGASSYSNSYGNSGASGAAPGGTGDSAYPGGGIGYGGQGSGVDGQHGYVVVAAYQISTVPTITSAGQQNRAQNQSAGYTITANATPAPSSYGASGLPPGFSLNTATGAITGNATTPGTYNSTVSATNIAGTGYGSVTWVVTAASITNNGSVSPGSIALGQSVTLYRDGSANFGIASTQNTMWFPGGGSQDLGNALLGSQSYTPAAGIGTYTYQFRIYDAYSNYQDQWINFSVVDGTAPSVPSGLAASNVTISSFTLSWSASSDNVAVTGYEVFRDGVSLGTTSSLSMVVTGLSPNTTYAMTVRARDAAGNWSAQSSTLYVTTPADGAAPSVPTGLASSSVGVTSFTLGWNASSDNVGVTGYEVLRNGVSLGTTSSLSMVVTGLSPNTTYAMTVRARDAAGNWSAQSTALNVTTLADSAAPSVPSGLSANSIVETSFNLAWSASSDNVSVTAYEVFRSGVSLGSTSSLGMTVAGLSPNTTFAMTVRARDAAGNWSAQSTALNVTTAPDVAAPSVPTGLVQSVPGSYSFTLSWSASSDNIGVVEYEVRRDGVSLGTTTSLSRAVTGLAPNTTCSMTVRARDAAGNWSAWSTAVNITTAGSFEVFTPLN